MTIRTLSFLLAAIAAVLTPPPAAAQDMSFDAYLQLLIARARAEGVSEPTIQRMTRGLEPSQRVIELDRAQPGTPTRSGYPRLAPYIARHVDAARINGGEAPMPPRSGRSAQSSANMASRAKSWSRSGGTRRPMAG